MKPLLAALNLGEKNENSSPSADVLHKDLAQRSQYFNAISCNIVAWCCDMCCMWWPNARNIFIIFTATCQCLCAPGPWRARSGPNAHALAQQSCVNVKRERDQTSTTSWNIQNVARKFWLFSNLIQHHPTRCNISQHIATGWLNVCNMLCPTMLQDIALKCCEHLARTWHFKLGYFTLLLCWRRQRNGQKMKNARAGRAKLLFFPTEYANLWRSRCRCHCESSLIWAMYPKNKSVRAFFRLKIENERFSVACSRCRQNLEFGDFTSSLCRVPQKYELKCLPQVQHDYLCSSNQRYHCFVVSLWTLCSST